MALAVAFVGLAAAGLSSTAAGVGPASTWGVSARVVGAPLWPGVGSQTVHYTITNNTDMYQHLTSTGTSIRNDGTDVIDAGTNRAVIGCSTTWFTLTDSPVVSGDLGQHAQANGSATIVMLDVPVNEDACKGVQPSITVSVR